MIKVISGKYGSRNLVTLEGENTRPTSIKTRGAIFSRIGPYFNGGVVLDLFAGSGAFGIEALSRGFDKGYFIDCSNEAVRIINNNLKMVDENYEILKLDYKTALIKLKNIKFDLIFLDPPYKLKIMGDIIKFIDENDMLNNGGQIICESLKEDTLPSAFGKITKIKEAEYGISKITYYKGE